jgi:cytochrome c553
MRGLAVAVGMSLAFAGMAAAAGASPNWGWLFPLAGTPPADKPDNFTARHVPGSTLGFTDAQLHDLKRAVDWFPAEHPVMPSVVSTGHDNTNACGFCHLPSGNGRPENSPLAGLSVDYIKRQIAAFATGSRKSAWPNSLPTKMMSATARTVSPGEVDQAATYFSRLHYVSHINVVETAELGFKPARFVYLLQAGPKQPIGDRIIEVPVDPDGFERRDPHTRYTAYVPPGSLAAGRALVTSGGPARQPCTMCHGSGLRGGLAPALAGRSPTMMMRQLIAFKTGVRANAEASPMRRVTAKLDDRMMIALAAYSATLKP